MEVKGTLKYRKLQRTPQSGENAGKKKWYATAVTDREVDFEGFVSHISDHGSPYSRGTIHGVLMDALDHLQELILDGKSVRLSDLGLFSIGMTSKAEDTKEKVTAASVEGVHLIVRNTKSWSNSELRKKCKIRSTAVISALMRLAVVPPVVALTRVVLVQRRVVPVQPVTILRAAALRRVAAPKVTPATWAKACLRRILAPNGVAFLPSI